VTFGLVLDDRPLVLHRARTGTIVLVTELVNAAAPGVVATDDERYNASLVRRVDQHENLGYFWVKFDGDPTPFEPGQYMTIGVFVDGRIVQRPYSVASAPVDAGDTGYEMYLRLVQGGTFTPVLWDLPVGHRMRMIGPKGKFMLEPDDDRIHLFVSSGTGNAPFIAMMRQMLADRAASERCLPEWRVVRAGPGVSRPGRAVGVDRRVPGPLHPDGLATERPGERRLDGADGRVETIVGPIFDELGLRSDDTVAYLCGNPDMILAAEQTLLEWAARGGREEGAVLAEGQGAARRDRRRPGCGDRSGGGERRPIAEAAAGGRALR
jgi:ferredoxin-NADP reductase